MEDIPEEAKSLTEYFGNVPMFYGTDMVAIKV